MNSVTFPPALGGDGSTITDDAQPTTGLANGGHRSRFVPALSQAVAVMTGAVAQCAAYVTSALAHRDSAASYAASAATSAASALNAPGTSATSSTNLSIGSGTKALTLAQVNKTFAPGQWVSLTDASAPAARWMLGAIASFSPASGAMTVNVAASQGSGSAGAWVITAASPTNVQGGLGLPQIVSTNSQSMVVGQHYVFTNSSSKTTATLPSSPAVGDELTFDNATGRSDLVIAANGQLICGDSQDIDPFDLPGSFSLRFVGGTHGWRFK